jgi:CarD family transcriptional regulator
MCEMYQVGDWITYGNRGVCHVAEIKTIDSPWIDNGELYYVLKPLSQNYTISTPVSNTKVFTRPIISKREAEQLVDGIASLEARAYHSERVHELAEHYKTFVVTHDCGDLIELTMSLYAKKQQVGEVKGRFGAVDQKFMKQAEDLLFGELSVALGIPREAVPGYIASRVDGQKRREEQRSIPTSEAGH